MQRIDAIRVLIRFFATENLCISSLGALRQDWWNLVPRVGNTYSMAINAGLADPTIKARLVDLDATPLPMSSAEFGKFIIGETAKWRKVIEFAGTTLANARSHAQRTP